MIPAVATAIVAALSLTLEAIAGHRARARAKQLRPALIPLRARRLRP